MELIWHGTAGIEAVCSEGRILFDPFVPLKGSVVDVKLGDFDGFTDVFVTHGHIDHISDLPKIVARNPGTKIRCTKTPAATLAKKGVPEENLIRIGPGRELRVQGFAVRTFRGKHAVLPKGPLSRGLNMLRSPARGNLPHILSECLACKENGETLFYEIEADGARVCIMGSLNLCEDEDYPQGADLLVLPYNGWRDNLPPAVSVIGRLQPKRVVLDHWDDTFPPLTVPLDLSPVLERFPGLVTPMEHGKPFSVQAQRPRDILGSGNSPGTGRVTIHM